jgi:hypothetical protein
MARNRAVSCFILQELLDDPFAADPFGVHEQAQQPLMTSRKDFAGRPVAGGAPGAGIKVVVRS